MPSEPFPQHLHVHNLFGIGSAEQLPYDEHRVLTAVYAFCQHLCVGISDLSNNGRGEASVCVLFRDFTLSLAAALALAERRLYEPAMRHYRAMVECRLYIQKLRNGDADRLANLLAADRLSTRKKHFESQIRLKIASPSDPWLRKHIDDIKTVFREDKELKAALVEISRLRKLGRKWYGSETLSQLADELGETQSYEMIYSPTSALFVHPGDADVHLESEGAAVRLRPLVTLDDVRIRSILKSLVVEAHRTLVAVTDGWQISAEIKATLEQAIPMMLLALDSSGLSQEQRTELEVSAPLPPEQWMNALVVSFDRPSSG